MVGSKQTIGDISGSKNLRIRQIDERGSEQSVGSVSDVSDAEIQQLSFADHTAVIREVVDALERLSDSERVAVTPELQRLLEAEAPDAIISTDRLQASAAEATQLLLPETTGRSLLTDASVAVGLISGAVAIATLTNPYLLAAAVPASLVATGFLQKSKLASVYGKIRQLLSRGQGESSGR